jgi:TctA family transporter
MLFTDRPDFVWGLIASMYLGNVVAVFLVIATVPLYASILRVPFSIIGPIIVAVIFSGAYQVANSVSDIFLVIGFGLLGYVFKKLDYPLAPLVLAMVLGDKAEDAFRQSMLMSGGSLNIFWSNGLVSALMALGLALLLSPLAFWLIGAFRGRKPDVAAPHDGNAAA